MKKVLLMCAVLVHITAFSQQEDNETTVKHELSTNLLDLVVAGSVNINYEHFLKNNQSFTVGVTLFDTFSYYDVGYIEKNNSFSVKASYNLYFKKEKNHSGFYFYPFARYRTGDITTEGFSIIDFPGDSSDDPFTYDTTSFSAGFGLGHKWVFNDKFTLGLNGELGRVFGDFDRNNFDILELRFGVNFGIRF